MKIEAAELLFNRLVNICIEENGGCCDMHKRKIELALSDFDIGGKEGAIAEYTGDITKNAVDAFCMDKIASGMSEQTVYAYKMHLLRIFSTIGKHYNQVGSFDIRAYLAKRRLDGISPNTIRNEFAYLSSFYHFLSKEGVCENLMDRINKPKRPDTHKEAFSDRDVELIRLACQNDRQRAIIEVLLSTGCRISELCGIRITDINGTKIVVTGKGDKTRTVYLSARAQVAVENYVSSRRYESPWLFYANGRPDSCLDPNSLRHAIEKIGEDAGVSPCNPHRFRHYYATKMNKLGMDLLTISKSMGHSSIETTRIYIDVSDETVEREHKRFA